VDGAHRIPHLCDHRIPHDFVRLPPSPFACVRVSDLSPLLRFLCGPLSGIFLYLDVNVAGKGYNPLFGLSTILVGFGILLTAFAILRWYKSQWRLTTTTIVSFFVAAVLVNGAHPLQPVHMLCSCRPIVKNGLTVSMRCFLAR
jgi:hypothetical protein